MSVRTNLCTRQKFEAGYQCERRIVPDYNLIYVIRGRVAWVIEGKRWEMHPGGMVIVPPAVIHHGFSNTRKMTLASVHVEVRLPGGQDVFTLLNPPQFQQVAEGSRLDGYFRGLAGEFDREIGEETGLMLPGWSHMIVRELFLHDARAGLLNPSVADPIIAEVLRELDGMVARPVALADLARRSGFSAQHLNRIFRRVLGMTPLQYLLRMRLERAASMLREGSRTVGAIAKETGFEDAYYFSRLFKQHLGQSPVEYRQAMNSDSPSPRSTAPFTLAGSPDKVRP
jgi:AraC-like DNA-binding protein